jgi:hypothetical protein
MTYSCNFYAKIIVTKCIDKNKTDNENIESVENYLKNVMYKEITNKISDMRRASTDKENELLSILDKEYFGD